MSEDPFDDIDPDDYEDREGDPFADLDPQESDDPMDHPEGAARRDGRSSPDSGADPPGGDPDPDPFEYLDDDGPGVPDRSGDGPGEGGPAGVDAPARESSGDPGGGAAGDADAPRGDPAFGDVDTSRGDPFESTDSAFEQAGVEGVDPDEVWERFTAGADGTEPDAGVGPTAAHPDEDVVVVSKHAFCEGCPHFTAPPDVACTHEGTEIIEFVGPEDVRVSNCPIVRERRELGEVHEPEPGN